MHHSQVVSQVVPYLPGIAEWVWQQVFMPALRVVPGILFYRWLKASVALHIIRGK